MSPVACPRCGEDDIELVEKLEGEGRLLRCLECGHQWQRGEVTQSSASATAPKEYPPVHFESDDAGYLEWTRKHPFGFVINTTRPPSAAYLMLHQADCFHITVEDHRMSGQPWTGNEYMKICSRSKHSLREWARQSFGAAVTRCQTCAP